MIYSVCMTRPEGFVTYIESRDAAHAAVAMLERAFPDLPFSFFPGPEFQMPDCPGHIRRRLLSREGQAEILETLGSSCAQQKDGV